MSHGFGPWSSSLGGEGSPRLSTFWRRRMSRLPGAYAARPGVSRREWLQLTAAGAAACALPTLREAAVRASGADEPGPGRIFIASLLRNQGEEQALRYQLLTVDAKTGKVDAKPEPIAGSWPVAAHDGRTLALVRAGKTRGNTDIEGVGVWTFDLEAGGPPRRVSDFGGVTSWSPDGRQLIVVKWFNPPEPEHPHHETWRIDLDGSKPVRLPIPETDEVNDWSPDGRWFVTVSDRHEPRGRGYQLYLMRPDGTDQRRLTEGGGLNVYPRFSSDGRHLAYLHQERGKNDIRVMSVDGGPPRIVVEETNEDSGLLVTPSKVVWSPDGRTLACIQRRQRLGPDGKPVGYLIGSDEDRVALVDVETKASRSLKIPPSSWINGIDWR